MWLQRVQRPASSQVAGRQGRQEAGGFFMRRIRKHAARSSSGPDSRPRKGVACAGVESEGRGGVGDRGLPERGKTRKVGESSRHFFRAKKRKRGGPPKERGIQETSRSWKKKIQSPRGANRKVRPVGGPPFVVWKGTERGRHKKGGSPSRGLRVSEEPRP